jgi:hypothetical protein
MLISVPPNNEYKYSDGDYEKNNRGQDLVIQGGLYYSFGTFCLSMRPPNMVEDDQLAKVSDDNLLRMFREECKAEHWRSARLIILEIERRKIGNRLIDHSD